MGLALEPLFGSWSTFVFMLGLFGASFSSLMGNATIGGSLLADGFGVGNNLSNMKVKFLIILLSFVDPDSIDIKSKSSFNFLNKIMKNKGAIIGSVILLFFILTSALAPIIAPYPVNEMSFEDSLQGPSLEHWLGTDEFGRDIWTRMLHGGRVSLLMGLFAVTLSGTIGVILGVIELKLYLQLLFINRFY